ncbi:DedA family protein [Salinisphaera sp. T31B1]|uniref:DedA family protein n=1 Tax=Salinisphaera sp. T31B1 TaxID=727963 RepID=UPI00333EAD12
MEGYAYLLGIMAVANLIPPLPAEATIPFAAALFDDHGLRVPGAIGAAALGLVLGTLPLYYLGRLAGETRVKRFLVGRGRWLLIEPADIDRSGRWFRRYGGVLVVAGRLIPGMRSMISLPAGFHRMPFGRFLVFTVIGSTLWATALVLVGHWLAHAWLGVTSLRVGLALLCIAVVLYLVRLVRLLNARADQS